tara:strand:- start:37139 stop:38341 length:1203 start_codon:yes stop_codon:yes gene_type:complete
MPFIVFSTVSGTDQRVVNVDQLNTGDVSGAVNATLDAVTSTGAGTVALLPDTIIADISIVLTVDSVMTHVPGVLASLSSTLGDVTSTIDGTIDSIIMADASFDLYRDVTNDIYRTDVSIYASSFLIEKLVLNGAESILGSPTTNSSGAAFVREINKVWVIHNGTALIDEYNTDDLGTVLRTITLTGITTQDDTEGLEWMGYNATDDMYEFATSAENAGGYFVHIHQMTLAELIGSIDISIGVVQTLTVAAAGIDNNSGAEGVTYDRFNDVFYVVGEGEQASTPRKLFRFVRPAIRNVNYTYLDAELTVTEPFDAQAVFLPYETSTSSVFDLSDIFFHEGTGNLLIMSHFGAMLLQVDAATGVVVSELALSAIQWEGVTLVSDDCIIIAEPNTYQLYNYVD